MRAVAIALVVGLVGAVLVATAGWVYAARRLEPTPVAGLAAAGTEGPRNVLVLHTETPDSDAPLSVAILQVGDRGAPAVLSLPLDLEVTLPGSGTVPLRGVLQTGGRDGLVAAVTDYTGIALHHFVELTLSGLDELDRLAGTDACPAGTCLADQIARIRTEGELTFDEVADHTIRLQTVGGELVRTGRLVSPFAVRRLVDAIPAAVRTDVELGPRRALGLVRQLAAVDTGELDVRTVPGFHDPASGRTTPYWEQAETLFQAFRDAAPLPSDLGRTDPRDDLLVPAGVRVLVLNGIGVEGVAGRVADRLSSAGFDVIGADNADEFDAGRTVTVVQHRPGRAHEAELVARELDGVDVAEQDPLPRGADVVVLVGQDRADP